MRIGANSITAAYLGSTAISAAYLGAVQVFGAPAPTAPAMVDYFSTEGSTFPWYMAATYPNAVYDPTANKTFITFEKWDGVQRVAECATYDHAAETWAQSTVGEILLRNDDHGVPAMCIDYQGFLHAFFGAHASTGKMRYRSSAAVRDASVWIDRADIGTTLAYPHPVATASGITFFARSENGAATKMTLVAYATTALSGGAATFGPEVQVVDYGTDTRFYIGTTELGPDGYIWLIGTRSNFGDNFRRDVYIYRYNPANGSVENIDGSVVVTSASFPINLTTANASFRIVTTDPAGTTNIPIFAWDAAGNFHVCYLDAPTDTTGVLYHIVRPSAGGAFSSPVAVMTVGNRYNGLGIRKSGTGVQMMASVSAVGGGRGGDIYSVDRTAAGVFSSPALVRAAEAGYPLENPCPVLNGTDQLAWVFCECAGGSSFSNGSVSTDVESGFRRTFAYGSGGYIQRTNDPVLALHRNTVGAALAVGDTAALVSSRQIRETLTLNDPSGLFAMSGRRIIVAAPLSVGAYPVTLQSTFRGLTVSVPFTLTVAEGAGVRDVALAEYRFGETGQGITDGSGNGLNGFLGRTSAVEPGVDIGRVTAGIENLTAGSSGVSIPYQPLINSTSLHVFVAMRLTTSLSGARFLMARVQGFTSLRMWSFSILNGALRWANIRADSTSIFATAPSPTVVLNEWALVEAEVNGTSVVLRQNGVQVHSATLSQALRADNSTPMFIGAEVLTANNFGNGTRGTIGEIALYPRPLNSTEATAARDRIKAGMAAKGITLP